jgi:hypothetical protein
MKTRTLPFRGEGQGGAPAAVKRNLSAFSAFSA